MKGAAFDMKEWMHILAVESLGAVVLSWSPGMLKAGTDRDTSNQSYLGWRRKSVFGLFPLITKLDVDYKWIGRVFGTLWGVTHQTPKGFKPFFPVSAEWLLCLRMKDTNEMSRTWPRKSHDV